MVVDWLLPNGGASAGMSVQALSALVFAGSIRTTAHEHTYQSAQVQQEEELVRRAQQYDQEALSWFYQLFYPKLYNYGCLQLGDAQLAEDLASEVLLRVLESLHDYRFRGLPVAAWVFRIARNYVIDLHRRRQRRPQVPLFDGIPSADDDPHTLAERSLAQKELYAAMRDLTEEQRQVVILKFIEGLDNAAVARVLGRSEGAVKSLQHRALLALRKMLSPEGTEEAT